MADITVAEFRSQFGEFDTVDASVVEAAIPTAYSLTDVTRPATLHCIAHLLATRSEDTGAPDGGSGVVMSEQIGPRRFGFQTQAGDKPRRAFFATSSYGRRVLALEDRSPRANIGIVVGG